MSWKKDGIHKYKQEKLLFKKNSKIVKPLSNLIFKNSKYQKIN